MTLAVNFNLGIGPKNNNSGKKIQKFGLCWNFRLVIEL
jgi:hypothetical protein